MKESSLSTVPLDTPKSEGAPAANATLAVLDGKIRYNPESVRKLYTMPGEEVVDLLAQHGDVQEFVQSFLSASLLRETQEENAHGTKARKEVARYIDTLESSNAETSKVISELAMPAFAQGLSSYLKQNDIEVPEGDILNEVAKTHIIPLDLYHYWANIAKGELPPAHSYRAVYIPKTNSILLNLQEFQVNSPKKFEATILEFERVNGALTHEWLHSISSHNFWMRPEVQNPLHRFASRRVGVSVENSRGYSRLIPLNEGITQKITMDILTPLFENSKIPALRGFLRKLNDGYLEEQRLLGALIQDVPWKSFLLAYFSRRALKALAKEMHEKLGISLSELSDSMEREAAEKHDGYPDTERLIAERKHQRKGSFS